MGNGNTSQADPANQGKETDRPGATHSEATTGTQHLQGDGVPGDQWRSADGVDSAGDRAGVEGVGAASMAGRKKRLTNASTWDSMDTLRSSHGSGGSQ